MTVEKTDISKGRQHQKFFYRLFLNFEDDLSPQSQKRQEHFYESRATILERPAWRDDVVVLPFKEGADEIVLRIFVLTKSKKIELFDQVIIPNVLNG